MSSDENAQQLRGLCMSSKDIIASVAFTLLDSAWKQLHEASKQSSSSKKGLYSVICFTRTANGLLKDASLEVSRLLEISSPLRRIFLVGKIQECAKITAAATMWEGVFSSRVSKTYSVEKLVSDEKMMKSLMKHLSDFRSSGKFNHEIGLSAEEEQTAKEWAEAILAGHEINMDIAKEALATYPDVLKRVIFLVNNLEQKKLAAASEEQQKLETFKEIEQYGEFAYRSITFLMNCLPDKNPIYEKH